MSINTEEQLKKEELSKILNMLGFKKPEKTQDDDLVFKLKSGQMSVTLCFHE